MKLEINKIKIIGFSDGASVAMQFSLDHKEMVDSLVLVGANYKVDGMKKDTLNKIKICKTKGAKCFAPFLQECLTWGINLIKNTKNFLKTS